MCKKNCTSPGRFWYDYRYENKIVGRVLLFFLVTLLIMPSAAKDKRRNMAYSVLRQAREAHQVGRHQEAHDLFAKARFIWKDLPDQGWSVQVNPDRSSPKISIDTITRDSGSKLLLEFLDKPTLHGKRILDAYVTKFPDEALIKEKFVAKARLTWKEIPEPGWLTAKSPGSPGSGRSYTTKSRHSDRVAAILLEARQAYIRWDAERARALIIQARILEPGLADPEWLKNPPGPQSSVERTADRGQLIEQLLARPDEASMLALEKLLNENPDDEEVRRLLTQTAISAGAVGLLQRLPASASNQNDGQWLNIGLKWIGLLMVLATLVWQTYSLWVDLKQR